MSIRSQGARTKGYIQNMSTGSVKRFMFNPTTLSESRNVSYRTINAIGGAYPLIEFGSGGETKIPLEIYLRGTNSEVKEWVSWLKELVPEKSKTISFSTPPLTKIALGDFSATCVVTSIKTDYTMFDDDSRPIEATVSLSLTEVV